MPKVNSEDQLIKPAPRKKPLPAEKRRILLSCRVLPATLEYINSMGSSSSGRALDLLIRSVTHKGVAAMLDAQSKFKVVNLAD